MRPISLAYWRPSLIPVNYVHPSSFVKFARCSAVQIALRVSGGALHFRLEGDAREMLKDFGDHLAGWCVDVRTVIPLTRVSALPR